MVSSHCLLCLSNCANDSSQNIQIITLYDLLVPEHRTSTPHQAIVAESNNENGGFYNLCQTCYCGMKTLKTIKEQIAVMKQQITKLEGQVEKKVQQFRSSVENAYSKNDKEIGLRRRIRKSLISAGSDLKNSYNFFKRAI